MKEVQLITEARALRARSARKPTNLGIRVAVLSACLADVAALSLASDAAGITTDQLRVALESMQAR